MVPRLDDFLATAKRRRLDGSNPSPDHRNQAFAQSIRIIHNDLGFSVDHPHQQAIFLPPAFIPESKLGVERFMEDYPGNIRWYEDAPGLRVGELFGWPNTAAVVEGEDFEKVTARIHSLTKDILSRGLRFDVLLATTQNMTPRFLIFIRQDGESSLRPYPEKFPNTWGSFEMTGGIVMPDEEKFNTVQAKDVAKAFKRTTAMPFYQFLGVPKPASVPRRIGAEKLAGYFDVFYLPGRADQSRVISLPFTICLRAREA